jgi:hypothetical protein
LLFPPGPQDIDGNTAVGGNGQEEERNVEFVEDGCGFLV